MGGNRAPAGKTVRLGDRVSDGLYDRACVSKPGQTTQAREFYRRLGALMSTCMSGRVPGTKCF